MSCNRRQLTTPSVQKVASSLPDIVRDAELGRASPCISCHYERRSSSSPSLISSSSHLLSIANPQETVLRQVGQSLRRISDTFHNHSRGLTRVNIIISVNIPQVSLAFKLNIALPWIFSWKQIVDLRSAWRDRWLINNDANKINKEDAPASDRLSGHNTEREQDATPD